MLIFKGITREKLYNGDEKLHKKTYLHYIEHNPVSKGPCKCVEQEESEVVCTQ